MLLIHWTAALFVRFRPVTTLFPVLWNRMQTPTECHEGFIRDLLDCQGRLYGYILSALADVNEAEDVLQETNVVIWRKADEAQVADNFTAWACRVAQFQVLAHLQRRRRDRHAFDGGLIAQLADESIRQDAPLNPRRAALQICLEKLPAPQRTLITQRYADGTSVGQMASERKRPVATISQTLYRIRLTLMECVRRTIAGGVL